MAKTKKEKENAPAATKTAAIRSDLAPDSGRPRNRFRATCSKCYGSINVDSAPGITVTELKAICNNCAVLLTRALEKESDDLIQMDPRQTTL